MMAANRKRKMPRLTILMYEDEEGNVVVAPRSPPPTRANSPNEKLVLTPSAFVPYTPKLETFCEAKEQLLLANQ